MASRMPWIASSALVPRIDAPRICFVEGIGENLYESESLILFYCAADTCHRTGGGKVRQTASTHLRFGHADSPERRVDEKCVSNDPILAPDCPTFDRCYSFLDDRFRCHFGGFIPVVWIRAMTVSWFCEAPGEEVRVWSAARTPAGHHRVAVRLIPNIGATGCQRL
jgi:hypothetical protein